MILKLPHRRAAVTATATSAAAVPANATPRPAATSASVKAAPTPSGATKAPASTPVKASETDGPLVTSAAVDPGVYALGVGQVPWSEFFEAQLSDSVSAQVHCGSGNLLVTVDGFDIADAGSGLAWGDTFSSVNQAGWNTTTGADYRANEATPDAVVIEGPSGTMAVFTRDGDGFIKPVRGRSAVTPAPTKETGPWLTACSSLSAEPGRFSGIDIRSPSAYSLS